jgi:anti-sigma-K factor RskA
VSVSCLRVRDLLPEFALDVLPLEAATEVERHLDACLACRTEAEGFREGVVRMAFGLPGVQPDPGLEARVADGVSAARADAAPGGVGPQAGPRRQASRRTFRVVIAAALAAAILAGGSFSWALAMRGQVAVQRAALDRRTETIRKLQRFIADFQERFNELQLVPAAEKSKVFGALLSSPARDGASGQLLAVSIPGRTPDFVRMQVNLPPTARGPYRVLFERPHADAIRAGGLVKTPDGDYVLWKDPKFFEEDLSHLTGVVVLDRAGRTLLTGAIQLITSTTA